MDPLLDHQQCPLPPPLLPHHPSHHYLHHGQVQCYQTSGVPKCGCMCLKSLSCHQSISISILFSFVKSVVSSSVFIISVETLQEAEGRERINLNSIKPKPSQVCMLAEAGEFSFPILDMACPFLSALSFRIQLSPSSSPPSSCGPSPPYFLPLSTTLPSSKPTGPGMVYTSCCHMENMY